MISVSGEILIIQDQFTGKPIAIYEGLEYRPAQDYHPFYYPQWEFRYNNQWFPLNNKPVQSFLNGHLASM